MCLKAMETSKYVDLKLRYFFLSKNYVYFHCRKFNGQDSKQHLLVIG